MSYEEFVSLKRDDTVEDKNGILGKVDSIDILAAEVWVVWEDSHLGGAFWSHYEDISKY